MQTTSKKSSDEFSGGAPLHPVLTTPTAPPLKQNEGRNSESPTDEEKALVRASANFGSLKDPFAETPGIPRSIPPNAFSRPGAFPQPTPSRTQNAFNRFANNQSTGRYRSSTTVEDPVPRFRPGVNGVTFNHGSCLPSDPEVITCQHVFAAIMTATQYVNVSPGMSSQTQSQLTKTLQDISQGFSAVTAQLRKQRDEAYRGKEEEHERYKRAMHEVEELRKTLDNVQSLNKAVMPQLNHVIEREKLLKDHVKDLKQQLRVTQKQLETLSTDAMRFHAHHNKVIQDYKEQDEKHFKAMTDLENEVKALRSRAAVSNVEPFPSPTHPASVNNVDDGNCDSNSPEPQNEVEEATKILTDLYWDSVEKGKAKEDNDDENARKGSFVPNPQAPAWSPSGQVPDPGHFSRAEGDQLEGSLSGHSAEIIVYTGRGPNPSTSKSMTPYRPSPSHGGGAPAFIRTPFGIVFGEYPTVDENSHLPGDKMIPRDKEEWNAIDVRRAMSHLYDLCKGYVANCHLHAPPNVPYEKLKDQESYTWQYLMQQVYKDPEHAASHLTYLLSTRAFVPYLLHRTCVDYLLKKLLTPQVFLGFSEKMDGHLRALQSQLANIADSRDRNTPNRSRQRIIEDHATLIKVIASSQDAADFRRRTVERHTNILSALLDPCRAQATSAEAAQKSLRVMVAACFDISIKIWSSGKTLHYIFPECASKFLPGTMEALNGHHMAATPEELVNSQCRVSLVVTPTMTLRDDRNSSRMQCHAIHKAQVLVMK
ncbi:hypothetical protein GGS21DRAFT_344649 [Xylaria nigripes]|nr:hypothetical protein GGS21DRAFT_344649 [Xylaria nigripes]